MNLAQFPVFSVSQVNGYLKDLLDHDEFLSGLLVRGEISGYKQYSSGHHYFNLKDSEGSISCVMFRGDAMRLRFRPMDGMSVVAFGRVSVFPRDGRYQLYCSELLPDGRGALDQAFEQLKKKLEAEGLFSRENKKPMPAFPHKIALVTSPSGAAVRDMIRILGTRWPMAEILVVPVRVQGSEAAAEIASAIHVLNNRNDIDLIIAGRGGGSKEDLWAFNEEIVARAIFISNIPVVSAVGHEPDVTIADYVADVRASTPSNGAELAVPDQTDIRANLDHLKKRLVTAQSHQLKAGRSQLDKLGNSRVLQNAKAPIEDRRMTLDYLYENLRKTAEMRLRERRMELARLCAGLDALSPLKVLARGYAIAKNQDGVILSVRQTGHGEKLDVRVSDGMIGCTVLKTEEKTWQ